MMLHDDINIEDMSENVEVTQEDVDNVEYSAIEDISENVEVIKLSDISRSRLRKIKAGFSCGIEEYDIFLRQAKKFDDLNISKTRLLIDKSTGKLIGYMSLSSDVISLNEKERDENSLSSVKFKAIPALKIGKLAISKDYKGKGYGKFLIEIAHLLAEKLNEIGVACRFITVDADTQYNKSTHEYYMNLGFSINKSIMNNPELAERHLVSMRKDIFAEDEDKNVSENSIEKTG